jgi:hypothetical protein
MICVATVPWSLAQRPRTATSGSNQIGVSTPALAGHSGLSGNSTSATQLGTNFRSTTSTGPNTNVAAHIGINAGAQTGISNPSSGIIGGPAAGLTGLSGNSTTAAQTGINALHGTNTGLNTIVGANTGINAGETGINNQTGGAAPGLAGSSGNSTGATRTGANGRAGTNSTANTNSGAHTAAAASATVATIQPQFIPVSTPSPLPNNSALSRNFSTSGQSPSPLPSASVSPTPTPTPAQSL